MAKVRDDFILSALAIMLERDIFNSKDNALRKKMPLT